MESIPMPSKLTRRTLLGSGAAFVALAPSAWALTTAQAKALVDQVVAEITAVINSGQSEGRMINGFERIFAKYADVPIIAQSVLGPPARTASSSQMRAFSNAFQRYMAVKYGRQFRKFIGGVITVQKAEPWKSHHQVHTVTNLQGSAPFSVIYRVSDKSGRDLIFDMVIEGISLLKTEAVEVRAIYDANGRDLGRTTAALKSYG